MIKLAISGCMGKMGIRIRELAFLDKDFALVALLEKEEHKTVGADICDIKIESDPKAIRKADILIEFSTPEATLEHLDICLKYKKAMVVGTTGFSDEQKEKIKQAAKLIAIVFSPNMSLGVNLLFRLVKETAKKLSSDYETKIIEAHHIHKKDAPSGTAKQLAEIIKEAKKEEAKDIKSIREGEIVGDHQVIFDSHFDTIELRHSAKTRDIFAQGALAAAKWIYTKKPGLYSMQDVLG
ncbi:MAG: 4-hydroxy-tetrahydrodipicolinate reductase [Candidatus Omnitrophota bacterium]|nr:4-hydroxy-tetrahydrodipicolinate reductase [Candidatus Omnitrophota bacterium]